MVPDDKMFFVDGNIYWYIYNSMCGKLFKINKYKLNFRFSANFPTNGTK